MLDGSRALGAAKSAGVVKLAQAAASIDDALAAQVKDLLDRGLSLDAVVKRLAGALATQVAAMLGITPQAAQAQLAQAFAQAFGASGTGPPGETNAQRASALVQTLRQIAATATRVTQGDPGTAIRMIAGQRSDADTAKASPTPAAATDRLLRGALDALAGPAAPPATAIAPSPAPAPAQPTGDGRTVTLGPATALAAGGDTLLGRTLTRAVLADQQRSAAADAASALAADPSAVSPAAPAAPATAHPAVEAFLHAFAGALAQAGGTGSGDAGGAGDGLPSPARDTPAAASAAPDQPATPFGLALGQPAAPVDPALPASAAAAVPAPIVDQSAVVDQLVRGMQIHTADGTSEVRMRLDPEQLGDVSVKLIVSGGTVDASITASSAAARDAIAGGQAQLARTLADAGLKLQSFTVGLAGGGLGGGQRDSSNHHAWANPPRRIGGLGPLEPDEPVDDLGLLAIPSFGPPLVSGLRGYDYLA